MSLKKCTGECGLEKEENSENFRWINNTKKFRNECKVCAKEYHKKYIQENKEKIAEYKKEYYEENKEEILEDRKEYYQENKEEILKNNKEYNEENKEKITKYKKEYYEEHKEEIAKYKKEYYEISIYKKEYIKNRRKNNPIFKLMCNMSKQVNKMLKGKKAGKSTEKLLPFTLDQLEEHMEKWFKEPGNEWMNWGNQGVYDPQTFEKDPKWQLDHEKPISHFNITDLDHPENDPEFLACWDLSNLRPLSAKQNIKDGNRRY